MIRDGSEYLLATWRAGPRKFWFYHRYVCFCAPQIASTESAAERLGEALCRWERGDAIVVYSGPWGWYSADREMFESQRFPLGREVWERRN